MNLAPHSGAAPDVKTISISRSRNKKAELPGDFTLISSSFADAVHFMSLMFFEEFFFEPKPPMSSCRCTI
jgi:hypothetical protein